MSNPVNVESTVEYVEADFFDAHAALPQSRRSRVMVIIVPLILSSALSRWTPFWIKLVSVSLFVGVWWCATTWGRREFVRRALADFGPTGPRTATLRFDDFGISFESPLRAGRTAWSVIWSQRETERAFLVFLSAATPLVVPKRAFSKADQEIIGTALASRVPTMNSRRETRTMIVLLLYALLVFALLALRIFFDR